MNLFKRLGQKLFGVALQYVFMPGQWLWPDDNKDVYIKQGYKELPNLYSIISLIVQKSSIVPFEVYSIKDRRKFSQYNAKIKMAQTTKDYADALKLRKAAMDKVENTELERLLYNPNQVDTIQEVFEQLDGYKLLTGNSYLWGWTPGVGNNAKKPIELHVPPATMVSIITGDLQNKVKEYKFNFLTNSVDAEDVAHFKNWNPLTSAEGIERGLYGMSPLVSCRRLMQKYRDADISQGTMFKNMGPAGILAGEKGADVQEAQAIAIKDRWKQLYSGVNNAGDIVVTSASLKWQQIGFSPVDMNTIEAKEEILGELCNVYHVPIGMFTKVNSTENNMKESRKMMITDAVIPLVESRKNILNKWLAPKFGDNLIIEFDYTVFSEIAAELEMQVNTAKDMWWITGNEKRGMTGYDDFPGDDMDKIYIPGNLVPIDQLNSLPMSLDPALLTDPGTGEVINS